MMPRPPRLRRLLPHRWRSPTRSSASASTCSGGRPASSTSASPASSPSAPTPRRSSPPPTRPAASAASTCRSPSAGSAARSPPASLTFLVGAVTLRLRADYLAITTFGVAVAVQLVALNLEPLTGGPFGIGFIPRPFAATAGTPRLFAALNLGVVAHRRRASLYLALERLAPQPLGPGAARHPRGRDRRRARSARTPTASACRPSPSAARSWALPARCRRTSSASSRRTITSPTLTFQVWAMLIVGGSGNNRGAILGAVVVWGLWAVSSERRLRLLPRRSSRRAPPRCRSC